MLQEDADKKSNWRDQVPKAEVIRAQSDVVDADIGSNGCKNVEGRSKKTDKKAVAYSEGAFKLLAIAVDNFMQLQSLFVEFFRCLRKGKT